MKSAELIVIEESLGSSTRKGPRFIGGASEWQPSALIPFRSSFRADDHLGIDAHGAYPYGRKVQKIEPRWMKFTEETNAMDYLERAVSFIRECVHNDRAWKWVIIALHGSLYGFAICAVKGTDAHSVSTPRKDGSRKLMSFGDAIKACQNPERMKMTVFSRPLVLTGDQQRAIHVLQTVLRNPFEHYKPKLWSIEIHGMPALAIHCLEVIRFLALETGNYLHLSEEEREKIKTSISDGIAELRAMPMHQDYMAAAETGVPASTKAPRGKE